MKAAGSEHGHLLVRCVHGTVGIWVVDRDPGDLSDLEMGLSKEA